MPAILEQKKWREQAPRATRIAAGLAIWLLCAPFGLLAQPGASAESAERQVLRVALSAPADVQALADEGFDIWEAEPGEAVVYADASERAWLTERHFDYTIVATPTRGATDQGDYFTFDEYVADMQDLVAAYPDRVSLFSFGKTGENRDLWMLKISDNVDVNEAEPEVLLLSLQHAREWLSGMTLRGIVRHLLEDYETDSRAQEVVDGMEIFAVLVANPDGYVYTHTTERLWRKNRRDNGNGSFGVDINRNWPYQWSTTTSDPSSNVYRGPSPMSEPEDARLNDWILTRGAELVGAINYHTYGMHFMYPWAYTMNAAPNRDAMQALVDAYGNAVFATTGISSTRDQWSHALNYVGGGATIDYFQATLGIPTLTMELRTGAIDNGFQASDAQIAPSVAENIAGIHTFLSWLRGQYAVGPSMVIIDPQIVVNSSTQATLTWRTSSAATRAVDYGDSIAYDHFMEPDEMRDMTHTIILTGLQPNTLYHAQLRSKALGGAVATSGDLTFFTGGGAFPPYDYLKTN